MNLDNLNKIILEAYEEVLNEMPVPADDDDRTLKVHQLPKEFIKQIEERHGPINAKYDFFSKDLDTYFKFTDINKTTGSISHKIITLPSFNSLYSNFSDIVRDIKSLMKVDDIRKDTAARELFDIIKTNYRQLQSYLRTERPNQYKMLQMRRGMLEAMDKLKQRYSLNEQNEPEPEEAGEKKGAVLEDATDQILSKFPTLKAAIVKLQTKEFQEFVDSIDWISPRPTSFRINLKNGQDYILKWTGKTFEAQIQGKRYFINKIDDYQQALDRLAILYKEGPMKGAGEEGEGADLPDTGGGGGGGDFPGGDAAGGGGGGEPIPDIGGGEDEPGGADLTGEPVDFEEPGEEPEA